MTADPPNGPSGPVRVVEAVLVAGLTALVTGLVNWWIEHKKKKTEPKKEGEK